MRLVHRLAACAVVAILAAGPAHAAASGGKSYASSRPRLASAADAVPCSAGPTADLCIPVDSTFTVAVFSGTACGGADPLDPCSRNDDDYTLAIDLPFVFRLYGQAYTRVFLNNNGNLSFGNGYCAFSSSGFPVSGFPMVAPFWADVDTRDPASGVVHYRLDPHKLVVVWDHVGYFDTMADLTNTFEVVLSDGSDPAVSAGNNVCFCYGDMQWTTGSASWGVGGFGGVPATVGVNAGDGAGFFQIGRFDHAGSDYDGPGGAPDGVDYLDHQRYCANVGGLNVPPVAGGFPSSFADTVCAGDSLVLASSFAAPELDQAVVTAVDLGGLANATVTTVSGNLSAQRLVFRPAANQAGVHRIRYVAVDDGVPADTTTVELAILVSPCSHCLPGNRAPQFVAPTPACGGSVQAFANQSLVLHVQAVDPDTLDTVTLSATGIPDGTALPATGNPAGITLSWTPAIADTGAHSWAFVAGDGCDSTACSFTVVVLAPPATCPKRAAYWEEHRSAWPADSLRLGNRVYGSSRLARFLGGSRGDGHEHGDDAPALRLAGQLVAAKFNRLTGAGAPGEDSLVARADSLIGDHALPWTLRCGGRDGAEGAGSGCRETIGRIRELADALARANDGAWNPACSGGHDHEEEDGGREHDGHGDRAAASRAATGTQGGALEFSAEARPNPFRGSTLIEYTLPEDADVRIAVYDLQGRELRVLASGRVAAGPHRVAWDGRDSSGQRLRGGVYFYRVRAGRYASGRKLIVRQ